MYFIIEVGYLKETVLQMRGEINILDTLVDIGSTSNQGYMHTFLCSNESVFFFVYAKLLYYSTFPLQKS